MYIKKVTSLTHVKRLGSHSEVHSMHGEEESKNILMDNKVG